MGKAPVELHPTPIPPGPWSHVRWDIVGPIMESDRKDAILCIIDMFTKVSKFKQINTTITGEGVVRVAYISIMKRARKGLGKSCRKIAGKSCDHER